MEPDEYTTKYTGFALVGEVECDDLPNTNRLKLDDWWKRQAELVAEAWKFEDGHWEWQGLPSQEEEDSRKEEHRLAVIEKTRVREETEKSGKTFDDELYNKVHPEVLDGF